MRLPADEIGHSRCDRLLDDQVVDKARHRTADEDQQRHRQELAAVGVKHRLRAGRTQEIDERADVTQDRDFDQRHDQADRHQRGQIGPDLQAIAPVVADQARWRRAVVMVAKRVDAGLEETEHGLVSTGNRGRRPDSKSNAGRGAENGEAAGETRKRTTATGAALAADASASAQRSAHQERRAATDAWRIRGESAGR